MPGASLASSLLFYSVERELHEKQDIEVSDCMSYRLTRLLGAGRIGC